ncbi:hypothetical protein SAMN04515647_2338 [Cohaesibacter sp. ES.047]|nr:hypothetical protein SAMN04515647_2338 [Cohaesibacter sp. ES.047]
MAAHSLDFDSLIWLERPFTCFPVKNHRAKHEAPDERSQKPDAP